MAQQQTRMFVKKRNGISEPMHFDKITSRISRQAYNLDSGVDPTRVALKVIQGVYNGIKTSELDDLAVETCEHLQTVHPDFGKLGARICASNLQKSTKKDISEVATQLYGNCNPQTRKAAPLLADDVYEFIQKNAQELNSAMVHDRDFGYDTFGLKTLMRSYLLRVNGKIVERPGHAVMRIAVGLFQPDMPMVLQAYDIYSRRLGTHGSPTWFGCGTQNPTLSSCFLGVIPDSLDGQYKKLWETAMISKGAGGVGLSVHNVRAEGAYINGTGGSSNGMVPLLRVFNNTALYVDQGGGKRRGAFAMYLEPWHADILSFLELKQTGGIEEHHARDLFYALWINDEFMRRVKADADWSLFCPQEAPELIEAYGPEWTRLYHMYESMPGNDRPTLARKVVKARDIWKVILASQAETGMPYMCYKDAANLKSNQSNVGTIRSSNLCSEIMQYSSETAWATCTLGSIAVAAFASREGYDHKALHDVAYFMIKALNRVLKINKWACPEAAEGSLQNMEVGLGIQGLGDAFIICRFPYDSPEARKLNREIQETIYHAALDASSDLALELGTYPNYEGCPASKGLLQFDLWEAAQPGLKVQHSGRYDWDAMKAKVVKQGLRNGLLVALMPTATTSQILGWTESFEAITSNVYTRRTLAGEFVCVNKYLISDLIDLKLWSIELKNKIVAGKGSIQHIAEIPKDIKALYRTTWEISQKVAILYSAERGVYVCQSQSLNLYMENVTPAKLTTMHFYAWEKGLKTGQYYLRSKAPVDAVQVTLNPKMAKEEAEVMSNFKCDTSDRVAAGPPGGARLLMAMPAATGACRTAEDIEARNNAIRAQNDAANDADLALANLSCSGGVCGS